VESGASCGKIRDFPTVCLDNSFGVTHTSHNPYGYFFSLRSRKTLKNIDLNLPLFYSGGRKYDGI
jgi:hypothetical protein